MMLRSSRRSTGHTLHLLTPYRRSYAAASSPSTTQQHFFSAMDSLATVSNQLSHQHVLSFPLAKLLHHAYACCYVTQHQGHLRRKELRCTSCRTMYVARYISSRSVSRHVVRPVLRRVHFILTNVQMIDLNIRRYISD
jgi:hypothetical protein